MGLGQDLSLLMHIPVDDNKNTEYGDNEADSDMSEPSAGVKGTPLKFINKTTNGISLLNIQNKIKKPY